MSNFVVEARLNGCVLTVGLDADTDADAGWEAMQRVLDLAAKSPSGPWALGEITVTRLADHRVIREMPAKA